MGSRGPLPKPKARHRIRRTEAGVIRAGRPVMPASLTGEARKEWLRVVPVLAEMGILATVDRAVLIRYCLAWAEWLDLDASLRNIGSLVRGPDGNPVRNPLWSQRRDTAATLDALWSQLGLTPMARLRHHIRHETDEEPTEIPPGVAAIEDFRRRMEAQ
ncbi:MAG: phage terminase small subunit P27 family [Chloroflexi bacterium]|nr:phage terminase small subunit P27 family [Chloroflexota bacterium]